MLTIVVGSTDAYDESTNKFIETDGVTVVLEHSLVSLSKWESHFEKPFLSSNDKSAEEIEWYIKAMIQSPIFPGGEFPKLSRKNLEDINNYINAKMTATWFAPRPDRKPNREIITAELIYYWMISLNIPVEFENWHLNRLLTLIKVCNEKNAPPKKMTKQDALRQQREINQMRKKQWGTKG